MSSDAPDSFQLREVTAEQDLYQGYKVAVYDNLLTGIVYGAYIVVYLTSVCILLSRPGFTSSPSRMFMLGTTTLMFAMGIIALALVTTVDLEIIHSFYLVGEIPFSNAIYYYVWAGITCMMYMLCDIVCAWRTVVIWNKNKRIIAILVLSILGSIAAVGFALASGVLSSLSGNTNFISRRLDLILIGPTLATNLLSTGLVAWRAWQRRITVGKHLRKRSVSVRFERVFALLIESGLIYCCIWILYLVSTMGVFPSPGLTIIALFSGLYPTLIIILVSKQMSPVDHYSIHRTDMQFTSVPAPGSPTDGGVPEHVLTIRRDYTSDSQTPSTVYMKPSDEERSLLP